MAHVKLWESLREATGGQTELEVEARTVKQLLDRLAEDYPDLQPAIDKGLSVSIDGEMHRKAGFQKIPEGAEVVIFPRMAGG
ncbi:MAG: MoaD/ThiS family protein [Rhodovibrionaceae bacterium]|nr:MoaD/ThiS family protein [Rhodovibrionaceae bacterium]